MQITINMSIVSFLLCFKVNYTIKCTPCPNVKSNLFCILEFVLFVKFKLVVMFQRNKEISGTFLVGEIEIQSQPLKHWLTKDSNHKVSSSVGLLSRVTQSPPVVEISPTNLQLQDSANSTCWERSCHKSEGVKVDWCSWRYHNPNLHCFILFSPTPASLFPENMHSIFNACVV